MILLRQLDELGLHLLKGPARLTLKDLEVLAMPLGNILAEDVSRGRPLVAIIVAQRS